MGLLSDFRSAVRTFRRRPFDPIVSVVILALGLAATVTVFTWYNGYSRAVPGTTASGLVRVFGVSVDDPFQMVSYLDYQDYARDSRSTFEDVTAVVLSHAASVRRERMTEVAFLTAVAGNFFSVLDVPVALGRRIGPADDQAGAPAVAVISHRWWQRSFGASPDVVGQGLVLNGRPYTIVGVAAPQFAGISAGFRPDVWVPIAPFRDRYTNWSVQADDREIPTVWMYARLRSGVGFDAAQGELRRLAGNLDATYPRRSGPRDVRVAIPTWIDQRTRASEMPTVRLMLMSGVGLLILVCANVANLFLAVATGRLRELAVRSALGATRGRLFRMVLVENMILAVTAGVLALAVAGPLGARLGSYFERPSVWGEFVPRQVEVDPRVVAFALLASVVTGLVAGLLPALRASRRNLVPLLRSDATAATPGVRHLLRGVIPGLHELLITSQVALAVVLLMVGGLVLRSLSVARDIDPGFEHARLVGSYISTSSTSIQPEGRDRFFRELARKLEEEPWIEAATIADQAPLTGQGSARLRPDGATEPVSLMTVRAAPGYFETIGIPLVDGRTFTAGDTSGAPDVAVVSAGVARRFFPDRPAIGRRIWLRAGDGSERGFEIVGVVGDTRLEEYLSPPEPVVFLSNPQMSYASGSALVVRTASDPTSAVPRLYTWLREYEPYIAIVNAEPYPEVIRGFMYVQRMNAELFTTLALLAVSLASVGIFSVVRLAVGRRRREVGIRVAVGARPADIRRLFLHRAMTPVLAGIAIGMAGAWAGARLVRSLLFGVEPTDPASVAGGVGVLVMTALLAAYLPARRAVEVDPVVTLRSD